MNMMILFQSYISVFFFQSNFLYAVHRLRTRRGIPPSPISSDKSGSLLTTPVYRRQPSKSVSFSDDEENSLLKLTDTYTKTLLRQEIIIIVTLTFNEIFRTRKRERSYCQKSFFRNNKLQLKVAMSFSRKMYISCQKENILIFYYIMVSYPFL